MSTRTAARPAARAPRRPPARRSRLMPTVIGVIAVLGVIAVVASRGGDPSVPEGYEQIRAVQIDGDPLPALGAGADPAVGRPAPRLTGASFDGQPVGITDDGQAKVVMFVAHWCPHCRREVPAVTEWVAAGNQPDDVKLYAVSTATSPDRPNYPPSSWLQDEGWPAPVLADDESGSAAAAYGLPGFPYFVAIGPDGNVAARMSGELTPGQLAALFDAARS